VNMTRSAVGEAASAVQVKRSTGQPNSLTRAIIYYGLAEALLILAVSAGALLAYSQYVLTWTPPSQDVFMPGLIFALAVFAHGVGIRHAKNLSMDPQVAVVWVAITCTIRAFAILLLYLFVFKASDSISRGGTLVQFCVVVTTVTMSRTTFSYWIKSAIAAGKVVSGRIMVIAGPARMATIEMSNGLLDRLRGEGAEIVSLVNMPNGEGDAGEADAIAAVVGNCRNGSIDSVVILPSASAMEVAGRIAAALYETPVTVHVIPSVSLRGAIETSHGQIAGEPAIVIKHTALDTLSLLLKRLVDIVCTLLGIAIVLPVLICIAIAIKMDSAGPVLFRQTRHGYGNRTFRVFKFRTMRVLEDGAAFRQATANDPRITRVGRVLRRTNLDELPQLLNVLWGDMSLVGPRPHPVALNDDFSTRISLYNRRHNILPGITGWAQVNGHRGETDNEMKMRQRVEHDLWYVDNWSLLLDLRILLLTIFSAAAYKNAR
jgi:Undecaprenyl-phosphate glucose phosphotransferase